MRPLLDPAVVAVSGVAVAAGAEVAADVGSAGASVSTTGAGVSAAADTPGVESSVPPQATASRLSVARAAKACVRCFLITSLEPTTSGS